MTISPRRPRPALISLTDAALARARDLMASAPAGTQGLRVGVDKGGCAGMSYRMDYVETPVKGDEKVQGDGVCFFIAPADALFLLGARIDYRIDDFSARFTFENPNQTDACGCGESVMLKAALPASRETRNQNENG